jgi:hypothetical protein
LKKWLRRQDRRRGLARDLAELQARLDRFCAYYNEQRPHQGIGRVTPLARWQASPASGPASAALPHPAPRSDPHTVTVDDRGVIRVNELSIGVGAEWAGCEATVILDGHYATIFSGDHLVRHLKIDHSRPYQPSGRRRGGPHQQRRLTS